MHDPAIPHIEDPKLRSAVFALAQSGFLYRGVFIELAGGMDIKQILAERETYLDTAETYSALPVGTKIVDEGQPVLRVGTVVTPTISVRDTDDE